MNMLIISRVVITAAASLLLLTTFAAGSDFDKPVDHQPIEVTDINPAEVTESELKAGLASRYYLEFFRRDVRELPKSDSSRYRSFPGKPILQLNHQFGDQKVFDSGENRGVGMRMKGYVHFPEKGQYEMQALSNDGFILTLAGKLTINDPEQHSDRLSNIASVTINSPGWYQVVIEYFQRKGTAAVKLMWKPPGSREFAPLPPSVYAHLP